MFPVLVRVWYDRRQGGLQSPSPMFCLHLSSAMCSVSLNLLHPSAIPPSWLLWFSGKREILPPSEILPCPFPNRFDLVLYFHCRDQFSSLLSGGSLCDTQSVKVSTVLPWCSLGLKDELQFIAKLSFPIFSAGC